MFVDGDAVEIQSRGGRPLLRYFPELTFPAGRYVLDGEIVIDGARGSEELAHSSSRMHPAAWPVERLAAQNPASSSPSTCCTRRRALLEQPLLRAPRGARRARRARARSI